MNKTKVKKVLGVILAGGQSSRMGQNKTFLPFQGTNLVSYVLKRLQQQNIPVIINANGHKEDYAAFNIPVLADNFYGDAQAKGPLSGLLVSLKYAKENGYDAIISVAVDTPFFPKNLVERFISNQRTKEFIPIIAETKNGLQPTFGFWPVSIYQQLQDYLSTDAKYKIRHFASIVNALTLSFKSESDFDPFFNINTPEDLVIANIYLNKEHSQ